MLSGRSFCLAFVVALISAFGFVTLSHSGNNTDTNLSNNYDVTLSKVDGTPDALNPTSPEPNAAAQPSSSSIVPLQNWFDNVTETQDIDPKLFKDFWRKWELVTTRYKPEGQQLRFVYANKIGAEALAKGQYPFPEGTVFAKIIAHAEHDPIFDSSLIPGSIIRIQVMLKKANDPKARDGWVYSLVPVYDTKLTSHLTTNEIDACQACHVVAQSRDMVFSQPFPSPFGAAPAREVGDNSFQQSFKKMSIDQLPSHTRDLVKKLAPEAKSVQRLTMPSFIGTLGESREVLAGFAHKQNAVYILGSEDEKNILIAAPQDNCVALTSFYEDDAQDKKFQRTWSICPDQNQ